MASIGDGSGSGTTLQTVERALAFLEVVASSPRSLTVKDVAAHLGVPITTCYHLLNTLVAQGYLEKAPDHTLRIGFQAAVLYDGYRRGYSTQQEMNEFVTRLAQQTAETAWLSMLVNDSVVLTAFADGPQAVRATGLYIGLSGMEHVRSAGRAVMAFLDDEHAERILQAALSSTPPAQIPQIRATLAKDLAVVRERGWALDDQDYNVGIVGVAAPFFRDDGDVAGAVGIWAPAARAHTRLEAIADTVVAAAKTATTVFGAAR